MDKQARQPKGVPVGGQFAPEVKSENTDLSGPPLNYADERALAMDGWGQFRDGQFDASTVAKLARSLHTVEFGCIWAWRNDQKFGGEATLVSRHMPNQAWRELPSDALAYLRGETSRFARPDTLVNPNGADEWLPPEPFLATDGAGNFAQEDTRFDGPFYEEDAHECMEASCETLLSRDVDLCGYHRNIADNHANHTTPVFECVHCPEE